MPRSLAKHIDDPKALGRRLREARQRAGFTLRGLAFPGCSYGYLSRVEAGERVPSLQLVQELARRLQVPVEWLARGETTARPLSGRLLEAEAALRAEQLELAERLYREELEEAVTARGRALALEGIGQISFRTGRTREAIEGLEQALSLFGEEALLRSALGNTLGRAYATAGELEQALAIFERYLGAARERDDVLDTARFSVLLAYAFEDAGNFGRAEELVGWVLAREDLVDLRTRIGAYWAQSRLHILQHDGAVAERYARKVLALAELEDDSFNLALAHRLMADVELDRGEPGRALELLDQGEAIMRPFGNAREQASFHVDRARALAQLGELDQARDLAMGASGMLVGKAGSTETGHSYAQLAQTFRGAGDQARAIELYELACEFLEQRPTRYLLDAYRELAELLAETGRTEEEVAVLRKALQVQTEVGRLLTPSE